MKPNHALARLRAGQAVIGAEMSQIAHPLVPRLFAEAGFDFVFLDMEHTPYGLETIADLIASARSADIVPIVRVPQAEYAWISRVLDAGAQGIVVPRVSTAELARDIVSWVHYPPHGIRGFACTARQTDGQSPAVGEFMDAQRTQTLVCVQIERVEAVRNLEEIVSVPGIDVACLGYMDLTVDMGLPGQTRNPRVIEAIQQIIDRGAAHGVAGGIIHPDLAVLGEWIQRGMRFVSLPSDADFLRRAAGESAAKLRDMLSGTLSATTT